MLMFIYTKQSIILLNCVVCRQVLGQRNSWRFKFNLYNMVCNRKMCIDITLLGTNSRYFMINTHFYEWFKLGLRSKIASSRGLSFRFPFWSSDPSISTYCIAGKKLAKFFALFAGKKSGKLMIIKISQW